MINIKWTYPVSLSEATSLLEKENVVIHGGGTNLSGRDISNVEGIICLKKLGLDYVKKDKDIIEIGAMSSYADVVKALSSLSPEHILLKALKNAANTPCRNRTTIGGSIAFVPTWSDRAGALLALDATLVLAGKNEGEVKVADYLKNKALQEKTLILAVKIKDTPHRSFHYRDVKTANDMPLFTITVLLELENDVIKSAGIFIVGTKQLITGLPELESYLLGKSKDDIVDSEVQDLVNVSIVGSRITDTDYMSIKAKIETARAIFSALEDDQ
ncbi:MAG: FAD binding domain-containing protein [Candidatus Marinimicrobia bacterium]|nr:FAD binding domain-containing protein [Candidatus Neomarinimicrobiota bacterium]